MTKTTTTTADLIACRLLRRRIEGNRSGLSLAAAVALTGATEAAVLAAVADSDELAAGRAFGRVSIYRRG